MRFSIRNSGIIATCAGITSAAEQRPGRSRSRPGEAQLGERIAGQRVEQQRQQRRAGGDQQAVGEVAAHAGAREQLAVVRRALAPRGSSGGGKRARLAGRHERHRQHPQPAATGVSSGDHQRAAPLTTRLRARPLHHGASAAPRRRAACSQRDREHDQRTAGTPPPTREPRFHHLKPSSYMKYSTLTVLCSGPPCVITYGSAKSWK